MTIQASGAAPSQNELTSKKNDTLEYLKNFTCSLIKVIEETGIRIFGMQSDHSTNEIHQKIEQLHSDSQSNIHMATSPKEIHQCYTVFFSSLRNIKIDLPQEYHHPVQMHIEELKSAYIFQQTKQRCLEQFESLLNGLREKLKVTSEQYLPKDLSNCDDCISEISRHLEQVSDDFNTQLIFAEDKKNLQEILKNSLSELIKINGKWPIAIHRFNELKKDAEDKILLIENEFQTYLKEEVRFNFRRCLEEIDAIASEARQKLPTLIDERQKNEFLVKKLEEVVPFLAAIDLECERFSLFDFRDKIISRIDTINIKFSDLNFAETVTRIESVVEVADQKIAGSVIEAEKKLILKQTLDNLQEIDMEIEKKAAIREIQHHYGKVMEVIDRCESDGLSLQPQREYVLTGMSSSTERLGEIQLQTHQSGLNEVSQLFVVMNGTLSQLSRALKDVYTAYGKTRILKLIQSLPFNAGAKKISGRIDDEGEKILDLTQDKIVHEFVDAITWGDQSTYRSCPPLLSEDEMREIIQQHMIRAEQTIYLCYMEQCIKKSLKFFLLRKKWDALPEDQLKLLKDKGEELCNEGKKEAKDLLTENIGKNPKDFIERKIEALIADYIGRIQQLKA